MLHNFDVVCIILLLKLTKARYENNLRATDGPGKHKNRNCTRYLRISDMMYSALVLVFSTTLVFGEESQDIERRRGKFKHLTEFVMHQF